MYPTGIHQRVPDSRRGILALQRLAEVAREARATSCSYRQNENTLPALGAESPSQVAIYESRVRSGVRGAGQTSECVLEAQGSPGNEDQTAMLVAEWLVVRAITRYLRL